MSEQVAIIRDVVVGSDEHGGAALRFTTYITESTAASQWLDWATAGQICAGFSDIRQLEGKPCWVEVDGNLIKFLRLWSR